MKFTVPGKLDGIIVRNYLRRYCGISARLLAKLKRVENGITVSGQLKRSTDRLSGGDIIELRLPDEESLIDPQKIDIETVYEDDQLAVYLKPPGMAVHPVGKYQTDTLANAVAWIAQSRGESFVFHPVNRLDKDTSGLVLTAKNRYSASFLPGHCSKRYTALCHGKIEGSGTIDLPLRIKPGHTIQREAGEGGVSAVTHYSVIQNFKDEYTLLELWLETGRTHQIRAHLSSIGHPLAGDDMYGGSREVFPRQCLHCYELTLEHPITGEIMKFVRNIDFFDEAKKTDDI